LKNDSYIFTWVGSFGQGNLTKAILIVAHTVSVLGIMVVS